MCYAVDSMREVYIPSKEIEEILDNFRCINSTDMYYDVLKKRMHHYKETEGHKERHLRKQVPSWNPAPKVELPKAEITSYSEAPVLGANRAGIFIYAYFSDRER